MVDTCCENYDNCSTDHDKDAEIKRLNGKIEFLARTNMLYSDWEHRETQVTSDLIRKGIEEAKINAELRAEIERLKKREWVGLDELELADLHAALMVKLQGCYETKDLYRAIEAKLKEKNT
jgi:glutathione S-transferase